MGSLLISVFVLLFNSIFGGISASVPIILMLSASFILLAIDFDRRNVRAAEVVLIALMCALGVCGRMIFAPIQFFKPVSATVIICGMYFGSVSGLWCGIMTAVISNAYFMQGPWTLFQMLAWGLIGLLAGLLEKTLKKHGTYLILFSVLAAILYSAVMDLWTVLSLGSFTLSAYLTTLAASMPVCLIYMVSNCIFIILLHPVFKRTINRIKKKYL